jgi:DNA-binding PadR family transcriptional regulator
MPPRSPRHHPPAPEPTPALTPVAINILLALVEHDRHGLGIARDVSTFTDGRMVLGPGTLYGSIKRLLELGLIDDAAVDPGRDRPDPRRRYYRITLAGRRALEERAQELAHLVGIAKLRRVL